MNTLTKGQRGELAALTHLEARGYAIAARNWRCKWGELDIVARDGATIVFIEVRLRASLELAFESVNARKRARLLKAAQMWLSEHNAQDAAWRIDVIAVSGGLLQHREDALDW